jgi:hypothetical protein
MSWINNGSCAGGFLGTDPANRLVLQLARESGVIQALRSSAASGGMIAHHLSKAPGNMFSHRHTKELLHHNAGMTVGGSYRDVMRKIMHSNFNSYGHMAPYRDGAVPMGMALCSAAKRPRM